MTPPEPINVPLGPSQPRQDREPAEPGTINVPLPPQPRAPEPEAEPTSPPWPIGLQATIDSGWVVNTGWEPENPNLGFYGSARRLFVPNGQLLLHLPSEHVSEHFSGTVDILLGPNAYVTQSSGMDGDFPFDLVQAFIAFQHSGFHLQFGKINTMVGAEVINVGDNPNITRSLCFYNCINFTDTGLRIGYGGDRADFTVGVVNGWDTVEMNNDTPSGFANLSLDLDPVTIAATFYVGPEQEDNNEDLRLLGDFVLNWQVSSAVALGVNYDEGAEQFDGAWSHWRGLNLYQSFQLGDVVQLVFREEYFEDSDGVRTDIPDMRVIGITGGLNFHLPEGFQLRLEGRHDHSLNDVNPFNGQAGWTTIGAQAVWRFDSTTL